MSYIGRSVDAIDNISTLDNLSFNGSDATFNLTQNSVAFTPVSADALQIQIDGIIQAGNYTVANATVTFDFTPSGSSVCNSVKHFGVGLLTSVSDGAVTQAKLGAEAVNESKIQISNAGSNGNFLQKQSGNTGGLTWASASADADNYFATSGLSSKDLGTGLHIKTADSGASANTNANELVIEGSGNSGISILSGTTSAGRIYFGDSGDDDIGQIRYNHDDNSLNFKTNTGDRMTISSQGVTTFTGNGSNSTEETVVIQNTTDANPSYANLVFKTGTGGNVAGCWIKGVQASGGNDGRLEFHTNNSGTVTERVRIESGGDFLVNCTSLPSASVKGFGIDAKSTVGMIVTATNTTSGDSHMQMFNPNGQVGGIVTSGSATSYATSSDYRLKENETSITDGITRLKNLKPYRFNFKVDPDTTVDGFFAHEVSSIVPEAISGEKDAVDENGDIKAQGIDQAKLVPLLTSALQEAITKIETLEAKVTALENK